MYHVSAQGVDECMINVHYYYDDVERILCTDEETLWTMLYMRIEFHI